MPKKPAALPKNLFWRDGSIWARIQIGGRELRRRLHTTDPKAATLRLGAWRDNLTSEPDEPTSETFSRAVGRWILEVLPKAVKPQVARRYQVSMAMLAPHFGDLRLDQITTREISDYISSRSQTVTNATIRRDLTALSRLLSACNAWGWATTNPAKIYDRTMIREQKAIIQPPTPEEFETLLRYAPAGMSDILRLLDQTGMRLNEAVSLERRQVDRDGQTITLLITKNSRPRVIDWRTPGGDAGPILAAAVAHLRSPFQFSTRDGRSYARMSSNFLHVTGQAIFAEAARGRTFRRFRIHDLRHAFAIRWLKNGGSIYDLSRHLGHSSVSTTEIYLRYLTASQERTAKETGTKTGTKQQPGTGKPAKDWLIKR